MTNIFEAGNNSDSWTSEEKVIWESFMNLENMLPEKKEELENLSDEEKLIFLRQHLELIKEYIRKEERKEEIFRITQNTVYGGIEETLEERINKNPELGFDDYEPNDFK